MPVSESRPRGSWRDLPDDTRVYLFVDGWSFAGTLGDFKRIGKYLHAQLQ